ncbi:nephrin-like [Dreissena polymorpha]|uniref:nephrin-like n=1 Tax=Dreissena polymorpha TaxID=45954 RepID=UPI00226405FA|nr:nephrin-like [Dreissena polymorpha]
MNYTWTLPGGLKRDGQIFTIPNVLSSGTYNLDVNNVMNANSAPQVVIGNANVIRSGGETNCEYNGVTKQDIVCHVSIHRRKPTKDEFHVETSAPRASPFMPPVPKVWTKTNSSVILTYTIVAHPPPRTSSALVWRKQVNNEWFIVNDNTRINIQISQDRLQTNLSIVQVQKDDFATYTINVDNDIGSTEQTFVIQVKEEPAIPEQFGIPENTITDSSVIVEWKPGFNGGDDQWFVIGYKQHTGEKWTYKTILEHIERISIEDLVAGTSYQFIMYAENSIGKSAETNVITVTTRAKSDQRSSSYVGAAAGGAVGGTLLIVILVMLWKYRKAFKRQPGEGAHYDDLFNRQANVPAANTSSEYETYKVESQHTNQYETLAETSFHEYSVLSPGGKQDYSVRNRVTQVTETDSAIVNQENLSFSET